MSKKRRKSQKRVAAMQWELAGAHNDLYKCHSVLEGELSRIDAEITRLLLLQDALDRASAFIASATASIDISLRKLNAGA